MNSKDVWEILDEEIFSESGFDNKPYKMISETQIFLEDIVWFNNVIWVLLISCPVKSGI